MVEFLRVNIYKAKYQYTVMLRMTVAKLWDSNALKSLLCIRQKACIFISPTSALSG